jgi:hypothetical protein
LQNLVIQAAQSQQPVDRITRFGNYFDNTTVYIGKYIGRDLFLQGMVSIRYDENQMEWGGIRAEVDLGIEMRTPLFDIGFNIVPLHVENLFVNDVSITVSRRWSFKYWRDLFSSGKG